MDEAHEILLSSLKSSGVSLPVGVSSIKDISSIGLVSLCAQSLRLILDSEPSSFPTSLPAATSERFRICAELATAIKSLGYREELGFHQFLYPSDEESYKLVRFLVERLSKVPSEDKIVCMTGQGQTIGNISESETPSSNDKKNVCQEGTSQGPSEVLFMNPKEIVLSDESMLPRNIPEHLLEEERMKLEQTFNSEQPEEKEKLIQLKEIEQEIEATLAEISKREAEHLDLLIELEQQPKLPFRKSYVDRITEITKNSRKLDADVIQILKETRELQLESNSIQERLNRTYAVVEEIVFREAKKDAVGRQAYRLLTSIHDNFLQIADTILATDRAQREAACLEQKIAAFSSRYLDIAKLQADLDSIRKENKLLEQKCHKYLPIS
ncbi:coiled-coil domain-containing protein 22 [Phalaenopsis equestris]|uniref:coiled-coil domain-containing protein 22 n=1 Tax=Phalaenopsis equestris TaxID=78828 RepID=UPI0009E4DFEA|nr:coiled-coil domain-containing protein 22 [Phalaenopsis equestris]